MPPPGYRIVKTPGSPKTGGSSRRATRAVTPAVLLLVELAAGAALAAPDDAGAPPSSQPVAESDVTPPRVLAARVAYPGGAQGGAEVELELVIGADGSVQSARVVRGSPPFADAALAAAPSFLFAPARRGSEARAARIRFMVRFEPPSAEANASSAAATPASTAPPAPPLSAPGATAAELAPAAAALEVSVQGERKSGATSLAQAEVRVMPGAFGDAFRALEALPSVTPGLSGAPYFYVRGAPPGNVGYFFDDIRLPALFHVFGGPGVLSSAWIERVDFYPGPYPAEYGRYAGAIVAASSAPPENRLRGELSVRLTDSAAFLEVPLGAGRTQVMVGGRYAYVGPMVRLFAPEVEVAYWDLQLRVSHDLSAHDRLSVLAFGASDDLSDVNDGRRRTLYSVGFERLDLAYEHDLDGGSIKVAALVGHDRSRAENGDVQLSDVLAGARVRARFALDERMTLKAGADVERTRYRLSLDALEDPEARDDYLEQYPARTDSVSGAYVSLTYNPSRVVQVNAGARADVYASEGEWALGIDPRLSADFHVSPSVTISHGLGIAHQPPSAVVALPGLTPALGEGLQTALQHSTTLQVSLPEAVSVSATVFQNATFDLSDSVGQSRLDNGDRAISETTRATGSSRGIELLCKRSLSRRVGGYLSYALTSSRRTVGRAEGPALFDRRHVLSGALVYAPGAGVHVGGRLMFYTGIPADVYYLEAAKDPPRTPSFYRLDLRAEKRFPLGSSGASWAIVLEVLNATLEQEVLNAYCNAYVCKKNRLGPITIPSIGLEASF
jgi:TonB-dependent receptor-like protein/TonB-like protein